METFLFIPTLFRSSRNFPVHPDTLRIFAYYLDILYSIRTFSKISGNSSTNNELVAKTFWICKNSPVNIADALTVFFWLCSSLDSPGVLDGGNSDSNWRGHKRVVMSSTLKIQNIVKYKICLWSINTLSMHHQRLEISKWFLKDRR